MSKRFFKIISIATVCLISLSLLAGCKTTKSTEQTAKLTPTPAGPVTLDYLAYNTYGQPDPQSEIIQKAQKDYNIKFNFWFVDFQKWDEVLGIKLASGDMPDVMRIGDTNTLPKYVTMGVLAPITDAMLAKIPNITKNLDTAGIKDMNADSFVKGQQYIIKATNLNGTYPTTILWRTDWLKTLGITKTPETVTEWETALTKVRNEDPDKNGKKDTYGISNTVLSGAFFGAWGAIPMKELRGNGTQVLFWTKKDNKPTFACIQPEMKEALTTAAKWFKDGLIDPEFVTGENSGGNKAESQAFANGKVAATGMVMAYNYMPPLFEGASDGGILATYKKVNPNAKFGQDIDYGKPPVGPAGKSGSQQWGAIGTSGIAITSKMAKDPQKVDAYLNMENDIVSSYDKYLFYMKGIKDKHHTIDPKSGAAALTKEYADAAENTKAGLMIFNNYANIEFDKKMDPLRYVFMDKYKTTGYTDMIVPSTEAAQKYLPDLKKLTLEVYVQIISGAKPVSYFDEYVKTFNEKGGAEIIKAVNEAIAAK